MDLQVEVSGITPFTLQCDTAVLDAKKPFEPFSLTPGLGSSFYFAHPELCAKRLNTLGLEIDWMGVPDDLAEYYAGYETYKYPTNSTPETGTHDSTNAITDNTSLKAHLKLYDNRAFFEVGDVQLFHADTDNNARGAAKTNVLAIKREQTEKGYATYDRTLELVTGDEVLDWSRYWKVALLAPDFQHAVYLQAAAQAASHMDTETPPTPNPVILNPPYTPKIKRLAMGYGSSIAIDLTAGDLTSTDQLYHVEPFGYREMTRDDAGRYLFLPQFENEGELYIGISDLAPRQNLSLLYQLAEGSADPDVEREAVHWSYLSGNTWHSLEKGKLLADTTNGLLNSGILTFDLGTVVQSTVLPPDQYWIRATIKKNSLSVLAIWWTSGRRPCARPSPIRATRPIISINPCRRSALPGWPIHCRRSRPSRSPLAPSGGNLRKRLSASAPASANGCGTRTGR